MMLRPTPVAPRVFRATKRDDKRKIEAGDLIVWDEENPDMPYSLVRPLAMSSAAECLGVGGMVEVNDLSAPTRPAAVPEWESPLSSRQPAPRVRHQKRA